MIERDVKKLTTEIIGFRQWSVNADLELASSAMRYAWAKDVNEARCLKPDDPYYGYGRSKPCTHAPGKNCDCGLYALHAPDFWYGPGAKASLWSAMLAGGGEKLYVAGLLSAWGRVEVHHAGFRAQFAKPVAIAIPEGKRDAVLANAVAVEYGLPTVPQSELERIASEFGATVPADMRPEKPKRQEDYWTRLITQQMSASSLWQASPQPIIYSQPAVFTWEESSLEKPEPGATIEELARRNKPKYDPRQFQPKRRGGQR